MKTYRINEWDKHFENNRTRVMDELRWVPVPNKHDGEGYKTIMAEPDGIIIYACWHLILQVASKCHPRGTLVRSDGTPHTARSIAIKTGCRSVDHVQRALDFCSTPEVGWITCICDENESERQANVTRTSGERQSSGDVLNGIEENRREEKHTVSPAGDGVCPFSFEQVQALGVKHGFTPDQITEFWNHQVRMNWTRTITPTNRIVMKTPAQLEDCVIRFVDIFAKVARMQTDPDEIPATV